MTASTISPTCSVRLAWCRGSGACGSRLPTPRTSLLACSRRWPKRRRGASTCTCPCRAAARARSSPCCHAMPGVALFTDFIVGFPDETEDEFAETLSLVTAVAFDDAYTFKYSVREGTPAVRIKDHVAEEVKTERIGRLIALVRDVRKRLNIALVGTTHDVLVEGLGKRGGLLQTRTRTDKIARVACPAGGIGPSRRVRFTGTTGSTFTAVPLDQATREFAQT